MDTAINDPDTCEWLGVSYRTMLGTADSGGTISITDSVSPPNSGPPRHIHHDADETFVLLTGECKFWLAGEGVIKGAGETVFIPRGTEHTFMVVGNMPCRHLVILTPGGFEGFFHDMAENAYQIPQDMPAIEASAKRFNMTFTGPPLSAG